MMSDPYELGSVGLLAIGVEPANSTETDWSKAAQKLQQQKSDGIPAAYYDQSYIQHLKNGDTVVSQCWSGDIFQANLSSKYKNLVLMIPQEGLMLWTDNMIIPLYASNPRDAMTTMDYFYSPADPVGRRVLRQLHLPGPRRQAGAAAPDGMEQDPARLCAGDRPAHVDDRDSPDIFPDAHARVPVEELLPVQEPRGDQRVDESVPADHPGRSAGRHRRPRGVGASPRTC